MKVRCDSTDAGMGERASQGDGAKDTRFGGNNTVGRQIHLELLAEAVQAWQIMSCSQATKFSDRQFIEPGINR